MPSFLMLDECGFVSKDSVAVVTESNSLFFPLFLLPDHTGVLADLYKHPLFGRNVKAHKQRSNFASAGTRAGHVWKPSLLQVSEPNVPLHQMLGV